MENDNTQLHEEFYRNVVALRNETEMTKLRLSEQKRHETEIHEQRNQTKDEQRKETK